MPAVSTIEASESSPLVPDPLLDVSMAAAMLAIDPAGLGGIRIRAGAGPGREAFLSLLATCFAGAPFRRIPAGIPDGRLIGGLDLAATLAAGRPVAGKGLLADCDGGVAVLAMAERAEASTVGILAAAIDDRAIRVERDGLSFSTATRFALVALDEGEGDDEALSPALADRLGLQLQLLGMSAGDVDRNHPSLTDIAAARDRLNEVAASDRIVDALCRIAIGAGFGSLRTPLFLLAAARAAAALAGRTEIGADDILLAVRLVLGISIGVPEDSDEDASSEPEPEPEQPEDQPPTDDPDDQTSLAELQDRVLEAVAAALPKGLLDLDNGRRPEKTARSVAGKAGMLRERARRGRQVGVSSKPQFSGQRPNVLATLRAAAPWQRLRAMARSESSGLIILREDFRYPRFREKTGTTAIFVVDASGSAAFERLAETKGAIETLLAQSYVRRDSVALIAFRGAKAETLLPPTRSLVMAKRRLASLPGGGGTPMAAGIVEAFKLAAQLRRDGQTTICVFMTDGRGNIALDGAPGREKAMEDADLAARRFRAERFQALLIDVAQRPRSEGRALADQLGAEYLALPRGRAQTLSAEIGRRLET